MVTTAGIPMGRRMVRLMHHPSPTDRNHALATKKSLLIISLLLIIVAWAVPELLEKWPYRKGALSTLSAVCLLCLFLVTWRQVGYWQNSIALYGHALEVTDANSLIHNNRGAAYINLGKYTQAIADYNQAIEINPRYGEAYYNRGVACDSLGNREQAIDDIRTAARIGDQGAKNFLRSQGIGW